MYHKIKLNLFIAGIVVITLLVSGGVSVATSFPFRAISIGDDMPKVMVMDHKTQQEKDLDTLKGTPYVAVFWGADIPTKKNRAIQAFKSMEELLPFLEENKMMAFTVNALGDIPDTIDEVVREGGSTLSAYYDSAEKVYGDLGIFVMPAILLVDKDGKVAAGMGYSKDLIDRLKGEVEIMLGQKTREQVELELRPETIEKSPEKKAAARHLNMGHVMLKRGMADAAIREFLEAIKVDPEVGSEAHIAVGCLFFDTGQIDDAIKHLDIGLEMNPDSLRGLICMAKIDAHEGDVDFAIGDLQSIMLRNSRSHELHYVLGTFYEKQGKHEDALKEYRKAYELLEHKEQME
ncbi:tetratricopeptide repeat protein [Thermodesulfobacteriota bacterium]